MNDEVLIEFSNSVEKTDRDALIAEMKIHFDLSETNIRRFDADWVMVMAAAKDTATIMGGVTAMASLAETLIKWRNSMKAKGASHNVEIKTPNSEKLSLKTCEDSELSESLTKE